MIVIKIRHRIIVNHHKLQIMFEKDIFIDYKIEDYNFWPNIDWDLNIVELFHNIPNNNLVKLNKDRNFYYKNLPYFHCSYNF